MRQLLKTTTYAVMHFIVAVGVAYGLTGNWHIALGIGLVEPLVQTVAYTVHERLWERLPLKRPRHGKQNSRPRHNHAFGT